MAIRVLFLDDGGVLNDNQVRGRQWQRLVGEFFAPRLGGEKEQWAETNWKVITGILEHVPWQERMNAAPDYATFDRQYQLDWMRAMCEGVGVVMPPEEEAIALAKEAAAWIIPQVRSAYPGVVETVRLLHERGHTLHTASGASSTDLKLYLDGVGITGCFGRLYGPDLVETFKSGPRFYVSLLADTGTDPRDALAVDDNPLSLAWAEAVGMRGVLVGDKPLPEDSAVPRINTLSELPALLERL